MRFLFDDRPGDACSTGVGRYARTLGSLIASVPGHEGLPMSELELDLTSPEDEELELPAELEREQIDLLYSPLWHLPAVLPCRAVVTVHDAIPYSHPDLTSDAFRPLWRRAVEEVQRADAVVTPTEHARGQVIEALGLEPDDVHVLPETPDAGFGPRSPAEVAAVLASLDVTEPYLLVVGSLERRKNPDGILDALAFLPEGQRPLVLFVGPAAGFDLDREASLRGLEDRARHVGLVTDDALAALYTGTLALLCCSRAEGFGLPIIEAWACDAPVIAGSVSATAEVAGDAALLAHPDDPDELAAAISRVVAEPELRDDLRRRGRARLEARYSPAAVLDSLAQLLDRLEVLT